MQLSDESLRFVYKSIQVLQFIRPLCNFHKHAAIPAYIF